MFTSVTLIIGVTAHLEILTQDWLKKGAKLRFLAVLLFCCIVIFFGCADGRKKMTDAEISEHFKNIDETEKAPV